MENLGLLKKRQTSWKLNGFLLCVLTLGAVAFLPASAMAHSSEAHADSSPAAPLSDGGGEPGMDPMGEASHDDTAHSHGDEEVAHAHGDDSGHGDQAGAEPHDHAAHAPNDALLETGIGRFIVWLGKFHPAAVHFPIAMLLGAAFAELVSMRRNTKFFQDAGRFSLWLGTLGAVGAALLGWFYGGFRLVDAETILTAHRWNGTAIAGIALLTLWLGERCIRPDSPKGRGGYRAALLATALMVGANGYLGGLMVYGPEQHQWPEAPAEHSH